MTISAVDLFCGAGGLTYGLQRSGIKVSAGFDFDKACEYAYSYNNKSIFVHKSIEEVTKEDVSKFLDKGDIKILVGCAPCQPFSNHTNKYNKGKNNSRDSRWSLLNHFTRLTRETLPDIISMENVPQLEKHQIFKDFELELKNLGYHVSWSVVFCPDYGVPQRRSRLVLLASRLAPIELIKPTHTSDNFVSVQDAIGKLPEIEAGEALNRDPLHKAANLTQKNMTRIMNSIPGGTWRDWKDDLRCDCHKRATGKTYPSVYSRMEWHLPAPTITTEFYNYGAGRFGHPSQNRAISLREGALLQTFPIDYTFTDQDQISYKSIGKMIGNAVPPKIGEIIGLSILKHIEENIDENKEV